MTETGEGTALYGTPPDPRLDPFKVEALRAAILSMASGSAPERWIVDRAREFEAYLRGDGGR